MRGTKNEFLVNTTSVPDCQLGGLVIDWADLHRGPHRRHASTKIAADYSGIEPQHRNLTTVRFAVEAVYETWKFKKITILEAGTGHVPHSARAGGRARGERKRPRTEKMWFKGSKYAQARRSVNAVRRGLTMARGLLTRVECADAWR